MLLRMAGLCAGSEQCGADIRAKILKAGFSECEADRMLEYLTANGYVDDSRFAGAYASDKVRFAGWGRIKIRMALRAKGIQESIVGRALERIDEKDYAEALLKATAAKARALDLTDVKDRQRLYRHLASRGFESGMIVSSIRKYMADNTRS